MNYSIRRLNRNDLDAYLALRLEALTDHPEAYGISAEEFAARPRQEIEAFVSTRVLFGVVDDSGALRGIVLYDRDLGERASHRGWLYQVYVQKQLRGTGAALALIEAAVEHARGEVLQLHLGVGTSNAPALQLYQKAGFEIYATEPRALHVNGRYIDEHLMVRFFDEAPGKTSND